MQTYVAISSKLVHMGGYTSSLEWAISLIQSRQAKIVKIIKARPMEKGRIVCEVTADGVRNTPNGRVVDLKLLLRKHKHGEA